MNVTTILKDYLMTNLLLILLLLVGCNLPTSANNDHCDLFSEYSEECAEIQTQCEEKNGIYRMIDNDDYENNSACCCSYD